MLPPLLLLAERKHVVLVLAVWVLVCFAVCAFPHGYENHLCAGAGIADSGAVHFPAAKPLVWCDNLAVVPMQVSVVLPLSLLLAERKHVVLVPAVRVLACFAVCAFSHGCGDLPCAGAMIADSGAARFPVSAQLGQDAPAAILV